MHHKKASCLAARSWRCAAALYLSLGLLAGCFGGPVARPAPGGAMAFNVVAPRGGRPLRWVVYGDMRFTATNEQDASRPGPRQALVARIASERPDALFLTGDVPWHGGDEADYAQFHLETTAWRDAGLRIFPVLGNHEFQRCEPAECLEHWWQAFPLVRGLRWYQVTLGADATALALDSDQSLLPGSEQAQWLTHRLDALPPSTRFVLLLLHHPPVTDAARGARPNESALRTQLEAMAAQRRGLRLIVCAAHVHNYEHFEEGGIVYLVSGGGGAKPSPVRHSARALFTSEQFPNFHYLRFELRTDGLHVRMTRLADSDAPRPRDWQVADSFVVR